MNGSILFPVQSNTQSQFLLSSISDVHVVTGTPAVTFNVTVSQSSPSYPFTFTTVDVGSAYRIAAQIIALIQSGSNSITLIANTSTPVIDSFQIVNVGANAYAQLVIDNSPAWTNQPQAFYIFLNGGTILLIDQTQTTATNVQSVPAPYTPAPVTSVSLMDVNQNIIATFDVAGAYPYVYSATPNPFVLPVYPSVGGVVLTISGSFDPEKTGLIWVEDAVGGQDSNGLSFTINSITTTQITCTFLDWGDWISSAPASQTPPFILYYQDSLNAQSNTIPVPTVQ